MRPQKIQPDKGMRRKIDVLPILVRVTEGDLR